MEAGSWFPSILSKQKTRRQAISAFLTSFPSNYNACFLPGSAFPYWVRAYSWCDLDAALALEECRSGRPPLRDMLRAAIATIVWPIKVSISPVCGISRSRREVLKCPRNLFCDDFAIKPEIPPLAHPSIEVPYELPGYLSSLGSPPATNFRSTGW